MVVCRPAGVPDRGDHVPGLHALTQRGDQCGVVIVDRVHKQPLELAVVADGDGVRPLLRRTGERSEEHTSELQSLAYLVCRLLLEKKKKKDSEEKMFELCLLSDTDGIE